MKREIKLKLESFPSTFVISLKFHKHRDSWDMSRRERTSLIERCFPKFSPKPKARLGKQSHLKAVPDGAGQEGTNEEPED